MSSTQFPTIIEKSPTPAIPNVEVAIQGWLTIEAYHSFIEYKSEAIAPLKRADDTKGFVGL